MWQFLKNHLRALWQEHAFVRPSKQPYWYAALLQPLATFYYIASCIRNGLFDANIKRSHTLPGAVISIGNLAVGGTGKTPLTGAVLAMLEDRAAGEGGQLVVLTRGYGAALREDDWLQMRGARVTGASRPDLALPDEPRMLSAEFPGVTFLIGARRYENAQRFLQEQAANASETNIIWVLDDGFQHRQIRRDIDILLWSRLHPFGEGILSDFSGSDFSGSDFSPPVKTTSGVRQQLPRGFLREGYRGLKRASVVVVTGNAGEGSQEVSLASMSGKPVFTCHFFSRGYWSPGDDQKSFVSGKEILLAYAVVGIANPQVFLSEVERDGINLIGSTVLADHAGICREDLLKKLSSFNPSPSGGGVLEKNKNLTRIPDHQYAVVTTAKDYWRNPAVFTNLPYPVYVKDWQAVMPSELQQLLLNMLGQVLQKRG